MNFVAVGRALPWSHWSARLSLLFSASAAVGCALECKDCVALQRERRCGRRIAFVASECRRISLLCRACAAVGCALSLSQRNAQELRCFATRMPLWATRCLRCIRMLLNIKKKFNALLAARTSLWTACSVLTFSTGAWPRVSLWTTSVFEDKTLLEQTPKCAAWADAVLVADWPRLFFVRVKDYCY